MKALKDKGNYVEINLQFVEEGVSVLQDLSSVQEKFKKMDTDTFLNELRDSIVGRYLGFELINTEKHGFDCKYSKCIDKYLEVKSASFTSKGWQATFNDTNQEKADAFKSDSVYLVLSVWKNASDLLFMFYGKNEKLGQYLEDKMKNRKPQSRSTQTISWAKLVIDYDFDVIAVNKTVEEVTQLLRIAKSKDVLLAKINIYSIDDFDRKTKFKIQ